MSDLGLVARSEKMPPNGGNIEGSTVLGGKLSLASLLVRESVQNAWDARDDERGDDPVYFEVHGKKLIGDPLDSLRRLLPVDDLEGFKRTHLEDEERGALHPKAVLDGTELSVLIVADRNTVGLCGPTRSGLLWNPVRREKPMPRGQQRFANFVRNTGRATKDTGNGDGGAFGVGKAALWMASQCGTVLVHSHTTDEAGETTQRFIGSIHGDHFFHGVHEYTGRHFVGVEEGEVVEPLVGAAAEEAVRGLGIPSYEYRGRQVDGTTIIIVAPRIVLGWETEMLRIRDAVRWQVWPKRVPGARSGRRDPDLEVKLRWNGNELDLPGPLEDPEVRPYALALLECANSSVSGEAARDAQLMCKNPKRVLGDLKFRTAGIADQNVFHLTLDQARLSAAAADQGSEEIGAELDAAVDFGRPWGQIALVRRDPLLLVKYVPIGGPDAAASEVGVFLSAADSEVEEALTKAEPPAHDDWIHQNVPQKEHPTDYRRTFVRRTLAELRSAKNIFLAQFKAADQGSQGGGERYVSQQISDRILGGLGGKLGPKDTKRENGSAPKGPNAAIELVGTEQAGDRTIHELEVRFSGIGSEPVAVKARADAAARDSTGSMRADDLLAYKWLESAGGSTTGAELERELADGSTVTLLIEVAGQLRIRPRVKVEVVHGT